MRVAPAGFTPLEYQVFVELPIRDGDNISRLSERACKEWRTDTGQVAFFRVREGRERALAVEADPSLAANILISTNKLAVDEAVEPGSWLLARVPPPPAAAPSASRL